MAAPLFAGKTESGRLYHAGQILISCVGLPARGKTHVAHALDRYLLWMGVTTKLFSLGDYRRAKLGDKLPADYFDPGKKSEETEKLRREVKNGLEDLILEYFNKGKGQVAIYDANNPTKAMRANLRKKFEPLGVHVLFIENMCDRDDIIEANIRSVKIGSPDYAGWETEKAVQDYWQRIRNHEQTYEPIEQPSFPYIKLMNVGETVVVNNIHGYLQSRMVFYLMNIHNVRRKIYFARTGQSTVEHSYVADSDLSPTGVDYAQHLKDYVQQLRKEASKRNKQAKHPEEERELDIWVSTRRRCLSSAAPFADLGYRMQERAQLIELNPGVVDGMSVSEIKEAYPDEYERSLKDPYAHRYPRGESYHDLSVRLEPIIFELERDRNDLLIIAHASVLRCLFAYLKGLPPHKIPSVDLARGDLIEVTPAAYGVVSRTHTFWRPSHGHEDLDTTSGDAFQYGSPALETGYLTKMMKGGR